MPSKTNTQMRAIFGLAKKNGIEMDEDTKAGFAVEASLGRVDRLSALNFAEANRLIEQLGGEPFPNWAKSARSVNSPNSPTPRRTANYRKQKAGVVTLITQAHLTKIEQLRAQNGMSPDGLGRMGTRMLKHWPPRTTAEGNKIVEALKAMASRKQEVK